MTAKWIGINPASQGNLKISTDGGTNQFWIKFGYDGLDLRLPGESTTNIGNMDSPNMLLMMVPIISVTTFSLH